MNAVWLLLAIPFFRASPQTAADEVRSALAVEDYTGALDATRGITDALERSRLERHVRHHAGDLDGALTVGEAALEMAPDDLELLLGTADVALSLGLAERAHALTERFARAVASLPADEPNRDWWQAQAAEIGASAGELAELSRARARALRRGHVVSMAGIVVAAATLAALGRGAR